MNRLALHLSVTIIYEYQEHRIIRHTVVDHFIPNKDIPFCILCCILCFGSPAHVPQGLFFPGFFRKTKATCWPLVCDTNWTSESSTAQICCHTRLVRDPTNYTATVKFWRSTAPSGAVGNSLWQQREFYPIPKNRWSPGMPTSGG